MDLLTGYELDIEEFAKDEDKYPDRHQHSIVEARYGRRSGITDNPDVCALPRPASVAKMLEVSTIPLAGYDYEEVRTQSVAERKESVLLLQRAFSPLAHIIEMGKAVDDALFSSYLSREVRVGAYAGPQELVHTGLPANTLSVRNGLAGRALSFVVYGSSGCGKTVAMNLIRSLYPAAIHHVIGDTEYIQIPIIMVTALVGNMSELMVAIARAIDDVIGAGSIWERRMKKNNVGLSASTVKEAIRLFHVGLIVIDESQFLKFDASNVSLENLIGIAEDTGCALGFIGNRDLIGKMDRYPRFVGRTMANRIEVSCREETDREFFVRAAEHLWRYQWTKVYTELTDEILKELLRDSMYNIAILKAILMRVQAMAAAKYPEGGITAEYIHGISEKRFAVIRALVLDDSEESERKVLKLLQENTDEIASDAKKLAAQASLKVLAEVEKRERLWGQGRYAEIEGVLKVYGINAAVTKQVINKLLQKEPELPKRDTPYIIDEVRRYVEKHADVDMGKVSRKRKKQLDADGEALVREVMRETVLEGTGGDAA